MRSPQGLKYDREKERISLGLKQVARSCKHPRPFQDRRACRRRVVSTTDYGAFIELEAGVEVSSTSPK